MQLQCNTRWAMWSPPLAFTLAIVDEGQQAMCYQSLPKKDTSGVPIHAYCIAPCLSDFWGLCSISCRMNMLGNRQLSMQHVLDQLWHVLDQLWHVLDQLWHERARKHTASEHAACQKGHHTDHACHPKSASCCAFTSYQAQCCLMSSEPQARCA